MSIPKLVRNLTAQLSIPNVPATSIEGRNIRHLYLEMGWWGISLGMWMSYLSVFAARLGASDFWIGALAAGPALLSIFWLMPAGWLVERQARQMPLLSWAILAWRFFILLQLLAPWLFPGTAGPAFVVLVILQAIPGGLVTIALTTAIPDAVRKENLGQVLAWRNAMAGLSTMVGNLISIPLLAGLPFPANYQTVFAIAFIASLISTYHLSRVETPARFKAQRGPRDKRRPRRAVISWTGIRTAWASQSPFNWFVVAAFFFFLARYIAVPLFAIYWIRQIGMADWWVAILSLSASVGSIVGSLLVLRLARRWSTRRLLALNAASLGLFPIATALSNSPYPLIIVELFAGVFFAMHMVVLFQRLIEVTPAARRPSYVGLYNAVISVAMLIGPMVGTTLAGRVGVGTMLIVAGGLRMATGLLFGLSRGLADEPQDGVKQVADAPATAT